MTNVLDILKTQMETLVPLIILYVPRVIGAFILIIIGFFLSKLLKKVVFKLLSKLGADSVCEKLGVTEILVSLGLGPKVSVLLSKISSIFILLIFIMSAVGVLGIEGLNSAISGFVAYLPNIFGALVVFFGCAIAGNFAKGAVVGACQSMNLDMGPILGKIVYFLALLIGVVLAVGQLKLQTDLINQIIIIGLVAIAVAVSLSIGLGTREISKNLVAGVYLRDILEEGNTIKIGDVEGELFILGPSSLTIMTSDNKKVVIPNSTLLEKNITYLDS